MPELTRDPMQALTREGAPTPRRPIAVPAERPWWWPSGWNMLRAWQVWAMLMLTWAFLCWQHGADAMGRFAWQACPWCEAEATQAPVRTP